MNDFRICSLHSLDLKIHFVYELVYKSPCIYESIAGPYGPGAQALMAYSIKSSDCRDDVSSVALSILIPQGLFLSFLFFWLFTMFHYVENKFQFPNGVKKNVICQLKGNLNKEDNYCQRRISFHADPRVKQVSEARI